MDIIFKRSQGSTSFGRKNFLLKASLSLSDEEQALIKKYKFDGTVLVHQDQPYLVRQTVGFALLIFILLFGYICLIAPSMVMRSILPFLGMGFVIALAVSIGGALLFYHNMRETILVRDIIHGRFFSCKSVVELARKEAYLQSICEYLRQVIESAKNWGEEEKFEILPLPKEEAKARILSGPIF